MCSSDLHAASSAMIRWKVVLFAATPYGKERGFIAVFEIVGTAACQSRQNKVTNPPKSSNTISSVNTYRRDIIDSALESYRRSLGLPAVYEKMKNTSYCCWRVGQDRLGSTETAARISLLIPNEELRVRTIQCAPRSPITYFV